VNRCIEAKVMSVSVGRKGRCGTAAKTVDETEKSKCKNASRWQACDAELIRRGRDKSSGRASSAGRRGAGCEPGGHEEELGPSKVCGST
jgi:hypothetical protein